MDEVKDVQKTDAASRFMDQYAVRTNPFGENRAAERAYRRAERIAAGLHMLTAHVPEEEPARAEIRSTATAVLVDTLRLRDQMRSPHSKNVSELQSKVRYLISLIRILAVAGFVSQANASTVIEALDELGNFISVAQRSVLSENVSISREDLMDVRVPSYKPMSRKAFKDMSDSQVVKDTLSQKDTLGTAHARPVGNGNSGVRVQNILEILKTGGTLGIKEIVANLPEYSEKMIQRELLQLVLEGKVKKTGLKRWSRYSIAG